MQPIKSNITSTGKCLNPVTTKCVVWDGPDITCLDGTTLCKGQNVETTLYTLATKLCEIYTALSLEDINTCINNINDGTSVSIGPTSSIKEVFSAIIKKLCTLDGRVQTLEDTPCLEQVAVVPECLRVKAVNYPSYNPVTFTLPLQYYAELVANSVCGLLIDIQLLQSDAASINQQIDDLWIALNSCTNSQPVGVLPTCTYNYNLNPSGAPVSVQTAYSWLEADYCTLRGVLGSNTDLADAINRQCANLANEDALSTSGTMSSISGWVANPTTVADTITNMWLTVCDMRTSLEYIVNTCCFSMCDYLALGWWAEWSSDGQSVTISFIQTADPASNPTVYTSGLVPPAAAPWSADGTALPAWVTTQFPTVDQTNVILTLDDGNGNTFTVDTGDTINGWAANPTQFVIDFTTMAPPSYDQTNAGQSIQIQFDYKVVIGTNTADCTLNIQPGLTYVCNAPTPYACAGGIETSSTTGTDMYIKVNGLSESTSLQISSTVTGTGGGTNTLEDSLVNFTGLEDYIVTITSGAGAGQCRYITIVISATEIEVDSDWDVAIAPGDTYTIQNYHYSYPYTGTGITGFNFYIVRNTPTFDINDQTTWVQVYNQSNVSYVTMSTGLGYHIPNGYLPGNTDYNVIVYAVYPCGISNPTLANNYNQVVGTVNVLQGAPGVPATGIFSSVTVPVTGVLSNNIALSNGTATLSTPVTYALALPDPGNSTEMTITPGTAVWTVPTGKPKMFCYCGITTDPDGNTGAPSYTPNRDLILGLYRGYDVALYLVDNSGNYNPILDSLTAPYKTDSVTDPTLTFSGNTPGSPITVSVPATYTPSSYPVFVGYDPTTWPVNTGNTYHDIRFLSYSGRIDATGLPGGHLGQDLVITFTFEVKTWDPGTTSYVSYGTPRISVTTVTTNIAAAVVYPLASVGPVVASLQAGYGDALYVKIVIDKYNHPTDTTSIPVFPPSYLQIESSTDPGVQTYSCTSQSNLNIGPFVGTSPVFSTLTLTSKCIITENYDFTISVNPDLT